MDLVKPTVPSRHGGHHNGMATSFSMFLHSALL
jgi:hypothetical protein